MSTVARTYENLKKCRCTSCPSYTTGCKFKEYPVNLLKLADGLDNIDHFEGMFCAFEKSHCISEDKGCLCEECPVFAENRLNRDEYCLKTGGKDNNKCKFGFSGKSKKTKQ